MKIELGAMKGPRLTIMPESESGMRVEVEVRAVEGGEVVATERGATADLKQLELGDGRWSWASGELTLTQLALAALHLQTDVPPTIGRAAGSTERGTASGLSLKTEAVMLHVGEVRAPEGLVLSPGELSAPLLELIGVSLDVDLAVALRRLGPQKRAPAQLQRLGALDLIDGELSADLHVKATEPIIGHRSATHRLRLDIRGGVIDYRKLEQGLATLENAAIDFELEGDQLILEKDLPLVPLDNTTLFSWSLDQEGQRLARKGLVRLSTLARGQAAPDGLGKLAFVLHELAVAALSASLRIAAPAVVPLVGDSELRLAEGVSLQLTGAARYCEGGGSGPPDVIRLEPSEIAGSLTDLPLGSVVLALGGFEVGATELAELHVANLMPARLVLQVAGATATDVRLGFEPRVDRRGGSTD
jgi:hypothetical protein